MTALANASQQDASGDSLDNTLTISLRRDMPSAENDVDARYPPGSGRELMRVALPLVISAGSLSMMFVIDRVLLARYDINAVAAALPAGMLHLTLISVFMGTSTYINTFVAQYEGAGRPERVALAVWQGIIFTLVSSLLLLAFVPLAPSIFRMLGHDPSIQNMEAEYFSVMCLGTLPVLMQGTLACFYSGRGRTNIIMWTNLSAMVVNGVLDYWFIYGGGPIPSWGIWGAAFATVLANVYSLAVYVIAMIFGGDARHYGLATSCRFDRELFARLMRFGLPNGIHFLIDIVCFSLFVHLVGMMGKEQLAASTVAVNLNTLAFVPMLGLGTAITVLTGKRIGEGRPELAVRTTWLGFRVAAIYTLAFAALYVLIPDLLLAPYVDQSDSRKIAEFAAVREQVVLLLRFVAVFVVFDAMSIVFSSAIRGAGDTRFAVAFTGIAGLLLMVLPTWLAYKWSPEPVWIAWTAATIYIVVLGVGFFLRFQQGRWKKMSVIEAA